MLYHHLEMVLYIGIENPSYKSVEAINFKNFTHPLGLIFFLKPVIILTIQK